MSRHFCFCIPVRIAVFFCSLLTFLAAGISAAAGWFLVAAIEDNTLSKFEKDINDQDKQRFEAFVHKNKTGIIVAAAIFTAIALMSFFGFIGSIIRNRRMVKLYSYMTILIFILGSVVAGFVLYMVWSSKPLCVTINGEETCATYTLKTGQRVGFTVYTIIEWLFELYIIVIIRRYYEQLEEEREYRHDFRLNPTSGGHYEAKEGLLTQGSYPYADQAHSYGNRA